MQRSLVPLAVLGLVVGTASAAFAGVPPVSTSMMPVRCWPKDAYGKPSVFKLSEVYRTAAGNYGSIHDPHENPDRISPNRRFNGTYGHGGENVEVVPGILCLDTKEDCRINISAFATCDQSQQETAPFIQSFRLTKKVPGSFKAPCYGSPTNPPVYYQFGSDQVRTWWGLKYTQPGTTFCLELTVVCQKPIKGSKTGKTQPAFHIDKWVWQVDLTEEAFCLVIDMLHSTPLSVLEFPCIADEGVFRALKDLAYEFKDAIQDPLAKRKQKQDAMFSLEGFIAAQCLNVDYFSPDYIRDDGLGFDPYRIPGNCPTTSPSTYGGDGYGNWTPFTDPYDDAPDGGIIESFEDPCCCKLMADVEYLGKKLGISSP